MNGICISSVRMHTRVTCKLFIYFFISILSHMFLKTIKLISIFLDLFFALIFLSVATLVLAGGSMVRPRTVKKRLARLALAPE